MLAVGAGGDCLDIFTLIYPFSPLSPSLWEKARYRLKYCLKGQLNPNQPTNQSFLEYEHWDALKLFLIHLRPVCRCRKQKMMSSIRYQHYDVHSCKQRRLIVNHHWCKGVSTCYNHRKFGNVSSTNEGVIGFSFFLRHPVVSEKSSV